MTPKSKDFEFTIDLIERASPGEHATTRMVFRGLFDDVTSWMKYIVPRLDIRLSHIPS